jgi:protein gp37
MGAKTGIEWTDATWNPIIGCSRVSEGCRNCYAEGSRAVRPGQADGVQRPDADCERPRGVDGEDCGDPAAAAAAELAQPKRVFVNSMSDLFHENVTDEQRDRIFAVMALCPQHTFQVLTKRPERMLKYLMQTGRQMLRVSRRASRTECVDFS